jgi:hypothetical protein
MYYNNIAKIERDKRLPITRALKRNYTILNRILGGGSKVKCSRDYLLGAGFMFEHFTSVINNTRIHCAVVYDLAFQKDNESNYVIFSV